LVDSEPKAPKSQKEKDFRVAYEPKEKNDRRLPMKQRAGLDDGGQRAIEKLPTSLQDENVEK
jgi:hypothetical protein